MKQSFKQMISFVLLVALLIQLFPVTAFATKHNIPINAEDIGVQPLPEDTWLVDRCEETAAEVLADTDILFEEVSLREDNVKHFRMDDGSYMAVCYDVPVHYLDVNNQWQEYDNTLYAVQKGKKMSGYRVQNGDSLRFFAADVDAVQLLTVQKGAYCMSLAPIDTMESMLPTQPLMLPEAMTDSASVMISADLESAANSSDVAVLSTAAPAEASITEPLLAKVQPEKLYSALEYADAVNGAALRYENYANTVKESIVISAPQTDYVYHFRLQTKGLTPVPQADGSILLSGADGAGIYSIPAPHMTDADDAYSDAAEYNLVKDGSSWILTVTADTAWMNDSSRAYPVLLDPTIIELELTDSVMSGGFVRSGFPNAVDPGETGLYVGNNGNSNQNTRSYFHVNDLIDLPEGCKIYYAGFSVYQYAHEYQIGGSDLKVGVYGMEKINGSDSTSMTAAQWRSFIAGLTWNNVNGSTNTHNTAVVDVKTLSSSTAGDYVTWDLTKLAYDWYDGNNLGFALIPLDEDSATSRATFYGPKKTYNRPALILGYRNTVGIEGYYTYQTAGIGRAGTSYISDYSLQNTLTVPLVSSDSTVMPFSLSLIYNSAYGARAFTAASNSLHTKDFSNMHIGVGWKLSAQQTIVAITIGGINYRVYTDADGTEHYFKYNSSTGKYEDEDGLGLSMTGSSSFTMTDRIGNTWYFARGYLTWFRDAYGNKISYNYNGSQQLSSITRLNTGGSVETLASLQYTGGKLISITNEYGKTTRLTYGTVQGFPCLTAITFPDGAQAQYTYYDTMSFYNSARLCTAYDTEGNYGMEYSYSYNKDVCNFYEYVLNGSIRAYGAKFHGFKRSHGQTVYRYYGDDGIAGVERTANDDILTYKIFDRCGKTINSYSTDSTEQDILGIGAVNYTESSGTSRQNNRITANTSSGQQGINLLRNSSAENGTADWMNAATSSSTVYCGRRSFLLGTMPLQQAIWLVGGESYTLSAYVRVESGGGLKLSFQSSNGTELKASSIVNYNTIGVNNGWLRLSVTYSAPSDGYYYIAAVKTTASGTVYADCLQLEKADAATSYNLLENASFEGMNSIPTTAAYGWYRIGSAAVQSTASYYGTTALTLPANGYHRILQSVSLNAPLESTFVLSGWAKANADPDSVTKKEADTDPYFGLIARVYYSDGTSEPFYFSFDPLYDGWQYREGIIVPQMTGTATITAILVVGAYDYNINSACMDNISLRMEPVQSYRYDDEGNLIAATQTKAGTENAAYNGIDLTQYTAANGNQYNYTYSDRHEILTASTAGVTNTYSYDAAGNALTSKLTGSGSTYLYSSETPTDSNNHISSATDVNGYTTVYTYNEKTEQLASTTADGITVNYGYNSGNGRTTTTYQSGVAAINYAYGTGLLTQLDRKTFRSGTEQHQYYNFDYNLWGQNERIQVGSATLASYEYEDISTAGLGGGKLSRMTYGNGNSVSYFYDDIDRLIKIVYNESGNYVENFYNSEGALHRVEYHSSSGGLLDAQEFAYDSLGRLIRSAEETTDGIVQRTEHIYDSYNRLSSQKWVIGNTRYSESYSYSDGENGNGSLSSMTTAAGSNISYTYDNLQRLKRSTASTASGNALFNTAYAYRTVSGNQSSAQVEYRNVRLGMGSSLLEGKKYSYDARGNITAISETPLADGNYRTVAVYAYDAQNQLTEEKQYSYSSTAVGAVPTITTYTYTYDTAGNILTKSKNGVVTQTYTYGNNQWRDLLTKYNSNSITYDSIGNPINYANENALYGFTWCNGRSLSTASVEGTHRYEVGYTYDADGIRTKKTVMPYGSPAAVHTYITQNGKVVRETIGTGSTAKILDFIYDESGKPFALKYSTNGGSSFATYYYVLNLQGDVVKLVHYIPGFEYAEMASYTYDAWGNILRSSGTLAEINPLRYRGYYYDNDTGFYYLQSRYYDPANHRLINADVYTSTDSTDAISCNMFAYCRNNPINISDPNGEFGLLALCLIGGLVSAAVDYGSQVYDNHENGKTGSEMWTDVNWGQVVSSGVSGAVSAVPGIGSAADAVDIFFCPFVEETVNCIVEGDSFNVGEVAEDMTGNILKKYAMSKTVDKVWKQLKIPEKIGDIKENARMCNIKEKDELEKCLNCSQLFAIGFNTIRGMILDQ